MDYSELTGSRFFIQMKDLVLSRRRCPQVSALTGCSMLLGRRVVAAKEPASADHSQPATIAPPSNWRTPLAPGKAGQGASPLGLQDRSAELTNHLAEGVVLTPSISITIPKLLEADLHYAT